MPWVGPTSIKESRVLLGEGKDEVEFFGALLTPVR